MSIFTFISHLFQIANPYPNEPYLFLEFKSAETIEGCPPDFGLGISESFKGFPLAVGLKSVNLTLTVTVLPR